MIENGSWRVRLGRTVSRFAIMMLIVLGVVSRSTVLAADERKHKGSDDREHSAWGDREHEGSGDRENQGSGHKVVLASDWSHKHLVYSAPKTVTHAFALSRQTRYVQQWVRRNAEQHERGRWRHQEDLLNGDWSMFLGNTGTVGADHYPAKFSFDVTTANCGTAAKPDFVVYNTSLVPSTAAATASLTATFTAAPADGDFVQITSADGLTTVTLTARITPAFPTDYQLSPTLSTDATNLAAAIASNGAAVDVTANSSGANVTVTSANVGTAENGIAVLASNAAAPNFPGAALAGGTNGASIAAFDNLYAGGCTGTVPSVYWAYNTGGTISTSITLSGDGSQVAFVQANAGTGFAELVLLKWKASATDTVNSPTTLTGVAAAAYRGCTAPCMTVLPFTTATTDSNSSPFYDFAPGSDTLYVGDDAGELVQFTGVFAGTPAQSGAPWPVALTAGATPTSPVFVESAKPPTEAGKVFIADTAGLLYAVDVTNGAVTTSGQLAAPILGFTDAPVVDVSAGFVYLFTADNNAAGCGGGGLPAVYQIPVGFLNGGVGANVTLGTGLSCSDAVPMYDGEFDNIFYSSPTGHAGNMYVCGNPGGSPTLYQIAITNTGTLGAVNTGPTLGTTNFPCSPLTEVFNPNATGGAKDWIFMSLQDLGDTTAPISCPVTAGCILSFNVTAGAAITTSTPPAARAAASGGASGVVVDNTAALTGASQVYFSTLTNGTCATSTGTGGCAVQASQSALF